MHKKVSYIHRDQIIQDEGQFEQLDDRKYLLLKESILNCGLIYPLTVRKEEEGKYKLIDGRHRFKVLSELGIDEIPVIIVEDAYGATEMTLHYDLELCRRHLNEEVYERKLEEKNAYTNEVKKSLRNRIFRYLKVEDSQVVRNILDNMTVKELCDLNIVLEKMSIFPKELGRYSIEIMKTLTEKTGSASSKEEIKAQLKALLRVQLEEKEKEIQEKNEEIFMLQTELEEKKRMLRELQKEYETLLNREKAIKEEIERRIRAEYEKKEEALLKELRRIQAEAVLSDREKEKILREVTETMMQEVKKMEEEYARDIAQWRSKVETLTKEIHEKERIKTELQEKIKKLEEEKSIMSAEKNRLKIYTDELKKLISQIGVVSTIEKYLESIRKLIEGIMHIVSQVNPPVSEVSAVRLLSIWKDTYNYFTEAGRTIESWLKEQNLERILKAKEISSTQ